MPLTPMKVLLDASVFELPLTGVAQSTLALYRACLKLAPGLEIVAAHRRPLSCALPEGFRSRLCAAFLPRRLWRQTALPLAMRAERPQWTHFPWNGGVPAWRPQGKTATTLHDVLPLSIPGHFASASAERAYRVRVQRDIDRSDVLITDSDYSRAQIAAHFRLRQPPVLIRLAPLLPQASAPAARPACPYFLYAGGYDRRKGLEQLLTVFLDLRRSEKLRCKLILTGSRHYFSETFKQRVEEGVRLGMVEEEGYVSDARLAELIAGALALVYPSKYEGFGLPPLDAMAAGCPVLTARASSLPEVCGEAVLYADPGDRAGFAAALVRLEASQALREELIAAGRAQAARFSWETSARLFLAALAP